MAKNPVLKPFFEGNGTNPQRRGRNLRACGKRNVALYFLGERRRKEGNQLNKRALKK